MILALSSCTKSAVPYHQDLQKEYSFKNRIKENEAFTMKSAKESLNDAKKDVREEKKDNKNSEKLKAVRAKTAELKSKSN